jgi:hypothetical protein
MHLITDFAIKADIYAVLAAFLEDTFLLKKYNIFCCKQ